MFLKIRKKFQKQKKTKKALRHFTDIFRGFQKAPIEVNRLKTLGRDRFLLRAI